MTLIDQAKAIQTIEALQYPSVRPVDDGELYFFAVGRDDAIAVLRGLPPATPTPGQIEAAIKVGRERLRLHPYQDQIADAIEAALRAAHTQPEPEATDG